ncbi:hypothetical protein JAAARDRAFT_54021 [Jaapia argillacea MUCL 33604]|uniref:Phospholipid/glycerol acyltransferase domain-containing protein n=1 Tax=Jaapia argillacea MUCL 33604 TaxID=933084 RepID=A0A067Q9U9_9AGAM|nr:hypothetical protein JAAARDRAFT_54021 [Jaapia argillacea MUCL 33604]
MTISAPPLYATEIAARPPRTWGQVLNAIVFGVVFNVACLMINASQFLFLLPLRILPFKTTRKLYEEGIRYTKGSFAILLILMSQWFAPTKLVVSFETQGKGGFTDEEIENMVVRNESGRVIALKSPTRIVFIANHQVYSDWWYAWNLMYFMNVHKDVFIVLKKSLKWVPFVGWGMQFFDFIFLARSWASDRLHLASQLASLGRRAEQDDLPLSFVLYPEGTLVSRDTRPISKKFADKMGIPDMTHTLLPRSTGLHYSLRSLAPRMPDLELLDVTVAYPGIPPLAYGQSYYTLRSIFCDRTPPPSIHMHIRRFKVADDVPIGDLSASNPNSMPNGSAGSHAIETDVPEKERIEFEDWLRDLWREKDDMMSKFLKVGAFPAEKGARVDIPLQLRQKREVLDAFGLFIPALVGYAWTRLR